jgi:hypothetical protein
MKRIIPIILILLIVLPIMPINAQTNVSGTFYNYVVQVKLLSTNGYKTNYYEYIIGSESGSLVGTYTSNAIVSIYPNNTFNYTASDYLTATLNNQISGKLTCWETGKGNITMIQSLIYCYSGTNGFLGKTATIYNIGQITNSPYSTATYSGFIT